MTAAPEFPDFSILESLLWTPAAQAPLAFRSPTPWGGGAGLPPVSGGYLLLEEHLARLQQAADFFGFPCHLPAARARLEQAAASLERLQQPQKVRLLLNRDGSLEAQAAALQPFPTPVKLQLAPAPVPPGDPYLRHKTTRRAIYTAAQAACPQAGDVLLWEPAGRLTESCLANLVCELDGCLLTPAGGDLLPGVLRGWLLEQGVLRPADLRPADLDRCTRLWLVNSVRGWLPVAQGPISR